jgi:transposase
MAILRWRQALVGSRTQLVNHVPKGRSSPSARGCPSALLRGASTKEGQREHIPEALRSAIGPILETIGSLTEGIRDYERRLQTISEERYPETELLRQVEGIGPLTALAFVLTLEDPRRFERSRSVGAYLGLVPATDRSGAREIPKSASPRKVTRCLA